MVKTKSLATYRDGGSMSVSFEDKYGMEYRLMFPVEFGMRGGRELEVIGYMPPVLDRYTPVQRVSPVSGLINHDWS